MRSFVKIFLTLLIVCISFASAEADPRDYYHGRGYDGPRFYRRSPYEHIYVEPPVVYERRVIVAPRPVVIYQADEPYVRVRCSNGAAITGTVIGGVAGGLVGNQFYHGHRRFAPTVAGTLIGALIGNQIGAANETCAAQALEYARPNTQVVWEDSGSSYVVQPVKTFQDNGQYCREYQTKVNVGGNIQEGYGTACRQPDGSWQLIN